MLNRMNKENTPYIRTIVKQWLNSEKIPHESYLGTCGFIVSLNKSDETISKILIQFEQVPKTAKVYTVVQHYPYQKLQVKFPATEISHIISKLLKYKFL